MVMFHLVISVASVVVTDYMDIKFTCVLVWLLIFTSKVVIFCDCLGITNGIDDTEWNPSSDENIASHYSVHDLSGKVVNSGFYWLLVFTLPVCFFNFSTVVIVKFFLSVLFLPNYL